MAAPNLHLPPARLLALTDGVYAIAMTIMVMDIRVPDGLTHVEFLREALREGNQVLIYLLSFFVLSKFWIGNHLRFTWIVRTDRVFTGMNLVSLALVALVPAVTDTVSNYGHELIAVWSYCGLFFLIGMSDYVAWGYASRAKGLVDDSVDAASIRRMQRVRLVLPGMALIAATLAIGVRSNALYVFLVMIVIAPWLFRTTPTEQTR